MGDVIKKILRCVVIVLVIVVLVVNVIPLYVGEGYARGKGDIPKDAENWMKDIDGNMKINQINIPGTHDSGTEYVELPLFSRCQALSVEEQLERGYRYLDIRLGEDRDDLVLKHGFTECRKGAFAWSGRLNLTDVLQVCYDFLSKNPSETIIFCVKYEDGNLSTEEFQKRLNKRLNTDKDMWIRSGGIPTLDEARGKMVLLRRFEDKANLGDEAGLPVIWENQPGSDDTSKTYEVVNNKESLPVVVQDRYEYDVEDKWQAIVKTFDYMELEDSPKDAIYLNFISTKGPYKAGIPNMYAKTLNDRLFDWGFNKGSKRGWVIVDYANQDVAQRVYKSN